MKKPGRFELTAQAEEDLIAIWDYISLDNPNAADRLLMKLKEKFQLLAENPELGATRPDIAKEMRYLYNIGVGNSFTVSGAWERAYDPPNNDDSTPPN